eukprot:gene16152-biopygen4599
MDLRPPKKGSVAADSSELRGCVGMVLARVNSMIVDCDKEDMASFMRRMKLATEECSSITLHFTRADPARAVRCVGEQRRAVSAELGASGKHEQTPALRGSSKSSLSPRKPEKSSLGPGIHGVLDSSSTEKGRAGSNTIVDPTRNPLVLRGSCSPSPPPAALGHVPLPGPPT